MNLSPESISSLNQKNKIELSRAFTELRYRWSINAREKQKLPDGIWSTWLIKAGRGFGKMLDVNTDILTTKGWKKLYEIKENDYVYNLQGKHVRVVQAHPITLIDGYELTFDTGEKIKACKNHLWYTISKIEDKQIRRGKRISGTVKTTQQVIESLKYLKRETNHRIPICQPLQLSEKILLISPYLLGIWLGDGASANAEITCNDKEIIQRIENLGYNITHTREIQYLIGAKSFKRDAKTGQFISNESVHTKLVSLNLIKNKHIPKIYLQASESKRLELLKGLMDSDGYCEKTGWCEYVSIKKKLAHDVFQLILSLGIKARIYDNESRFYGKLMGRRYRIYFKTAKMVFNLERKKQRQLNATNNQMSRHENRFIVDAKKIKKCEMRCLTVDSVDGLFLVTKSLIATHNTRTGAETIRIWKENNPILHLVGRTAGDVRDTMIEGESGILACSPDHDRPHYEPSKRRVTWNNGAKAVLFSAEEPDALRGPQCYKAWADELATWKYDQDSWDMLQMGLRLGDNPQCIITTTPKPTKLIRELLKDDNTIITNGTTYENKTNLSGSFFDFIIKKYEGTSLGRQELLAELLEDIEGALWSMRNIEQNRVTKLPELKRIIIPIDPAATATKDSDETGIIPVGIDHDNIGYVLEDVSGIYSPNDWANTAISAYNRLNADRVIGEANNGGDMIEAILRNIDRSVSYKKVWASKGKQVRAEPIAALYEQNRVKHYGNLSELETEMTTWEAMAGDKSPNRIDSLVWGLTELMLNRGGTLASA